MKPEYMPLLVVVYIVLVFIVLAIVVWFFEHKAKGLKRDPYEEPNDYETEEEKADRNFFKYVDKLNKDLDRP